MRILLIIVIFIIMPYLFFAQGLINNGGKIILSAGSHINIYGSNANLTNTSSFSGTIENDGIISLQGNWINNNTSNNVFINYNANGEVIFNGTSLQIIGGVNKTNFEKLTINKPNGFITFNIDQNVNNVLNLINGIIISTPINILTMTNGSSISNSSASSYIKGPIRKIGNTSFTFPVGDDSSSVRVYAPIQISAPNLVTDTFTVQYHAGNPLNNWPAMTGTVSNLINLQQVSNKEWWEISRGITSTSTPNITLFWKNGNINHYITGTTNISDLTVASYDSTNSNWENKGGLGIGTVGFGNIAQGNITSIVPFTKYSHVTIGLKVGSNPLPIELINFNVNCGNNRIDINWSTATEINNNFFTIERSADAQNWNDIGTVKGSGNSNSIIKYNFIDNNPLNSTTYYRLKQTDFDGNYKYSEISPVNCETSILENINVYPNPFNNDINISFTTKDANLITIYLQDLLGNTIKTIKLRSIEGLNSFLINTNNLPPSMYFIKISYDNYLKTFKLIKN